MAQDFPGPYNGAELVIVIVVFIVVSSVLTAWRVGYRLTRRAIHTSDYLLLAGQSLALCQASFHLAAYPNLGYGHHKADLPHDVVKAQLPKLLFWLNQVFFKPAEGLIKLSIASVYVELFRSNISLRVTVSRYCNFTLICVICLYYTAATLVSIFQCSPVRKGWADVPGTCIELDVFRKANGWINVFTSLSLIVLPFPVVLTLRRRSAEVVQILTLIALGIVHTGCATWRVAAMYHPNPKQGSDPQWYNTAPNTIAMIELFVGIIAATIIVMRSCFRDFALAVRAAFAHPTLRSRASDRPTPRPGNYRLSLHGHHARHRWKSHTTQPNTEIELHDRDQSTEELLVSRTNMLYRPGEEA